MPVLLPVRPRTTRHCDATAKPTIGPTSSTRPAAHFPIPSSVHFPFSAITAVQAPCVEACPVEPKAMFKTEDGITMHNDERCIGCRACQEACPYSMDEVKRDGAHGEYSVISYNEEGEPTQQFFTDKTELIPNGSYLRCGTGLDNGRQAHLTRPSTSTPTTKACAGTTSSRSAFSVTTA